MPIRSAFLSLAAAFALCSASSSCSKKAPPEDVPPATEPSPSASAAAKPPAILDSPGTTLPPEDADSLAHLPEESPARAWGDIPQSYPGPWVEQFQQAATQEEKLVVIAKKQSSGPENLAPLLKMALRNPSPEFRSSAVQTAHILEGQDAVEVLSAATYDNDENVRAYAIEMIRELSVVETRLETYRAILQNPRREVKEDTIRELGNYSTKPAFEVMLDGLDDPDPAFRSFVMEELMPYVGMQSQRTFENSGQARIWWQQHKERYDKRMSFIPE